MPKAMVSATKIACSKVTWPQTRPGAVGLALANPFPAAPATEQASYPQIALESAGTHFSCAGFVGSSGGVAEAAMANHKTKKIGEPSFSRWRWTPVRKGTL